VIYGKQGFFPSPIDLATSDYGFAIYGEVTTDRSGIAVSNAGDVNGDGISDILVGANQASPLGRNAAGSTYVIYGKQGGYQFLDLLANFTGGDFGFSIFGPAAETAVGYSVNYAGDVNNDGLADMIVGAPTISFASEAFGYVIYGYNAPPVLINNALNISARGTVTFTSNNLNAADADPVTLVFDITNLQHGEFVDSQSQSQVTNFTQTDLQSGRIRFTSLNSIHAPSYSVSVSDRFHTTTPTVVNVIFTLVKNPTCSSAGIPRISWYLLVKWFVALLVA